MAKFTETVTTTETFNCPVCESGKVIKSGTQSGEQRYLCHACNTRFRANGKGLGRRVPAAPVCSALRMFYNGMSYKQIAEGMRDMFDIPELSKATIYEWVKEYTQDALKVMKDYPAHTSGNWVVDERQLDVGGEKNWNWNVMDEGTRYLLASHLSKERNARAAETVLRKALAASADPPKTVMTDKLRYYTPAVKKVFPDAKHQQSEGIRNRENNNLSDRVQGTFRQRTKTLRGLDGKESGQLYLDGWVLNYNLFREHESLGDRPPAKAAKVTPPFTERADVVKGRVSQKVGTAVTGRKNIPEGTEIPAAATPERPCPRVYVPPAPKSRAGQKPKPRPHKQKVSAGMPMEVRRFARQMKSR